MIEPTTRTLYVEEIKVTNAVYCGFRTMSTALEVEVTATGPEGTSFIYTCSALEAPRPGQRITVIYEQE